MSSETLITGRMIHTGIIVHQQRYQPRDFNKRSKSYLVHNICFWITFIGYLKVKTWSQSSHLQCHVSPYCLLKDKLRLVCLSNVDLLGILWYRHSLSEARCKFSQILGNMYVSCTILSSGTVNDGLPGNRNWTVSVCLKCLIGVPLESTMPQPYSIIYKCK